MRPPPKRHGPVASAKPPMPRWRRLLWTLIWPQQSQRISPTISGAVLIALALGIGIAAYNSASNILFIALSLLLSCLILSGVLSWFNIRRVDWELDLAPAFRVGHETAVAVRLRNDKRALPTYGLWFEFIARARDEESQKGPESTITGKGIDFRAALASVDAKIQRGLVAMRDRLDPQGETRVEWRMIPTRRGLHHIELESIGSLFPFGFLKKRLASGLSREVVVWPPPIEYRRYPVPGLWRQQGEERVTRAGSGTDLLALRLYERGDSHRLIHWKASARTGRLLVRQFSAEGVEAVNLWVGIDAALWPDKAQFETMVSLAATWAEDLFRLGRLRAVAIDGEDPQPVLRLPDLEAFLDRLSIIEPRADARQGATTPLATTAQFLPDGPRGVAAYVNGTKAATA